MINESCTYFFGTYIYLQGKEIVLNVTSVRHPTPTGVLFQ